MKITVNEKTGFRVYNAAPIEVLETTQEALRNLIEACETIIEGTKVERMYCRKYLKQAVHNAKFGAGETYWFEPLNHNEVTR